MPTASDDKLVESLSNLRVEFTERFAKVDERLAGIETELRTIRRVGAWFLGGFFSVFDSVVFAAVSVSGYVSAVVSEIPTVSAAGNPGAPVEPSPPGR
jgi:hypothetical protein